MNHEKIVKYSNIVGLISIILLVYWVFSFISIEVFGLKIFKENMTQTFYLSIFGILALMGGTLMINIMMNLTRIASRHDSDKVISSNLVKKRNWGLYFALSFPLLFALLFIGDKLSANKKKQYLINTAEYLIKEFPNKIDSVANYSFTESYLLETNKILDILTQPDKNIQHLSLIVLDNVEGTNTFLTIKDYNGRLEDTIQPNKINYIFRTSKEDREYLKSCLEGNSTDMKFSASDGNYQLYYPYQKNGKKVVFYFSDYQTYGKYGS